jgi:hypothetical protein
MRPGIYFEEKAKMETARETRDRINTLGYSIDLAEKFAVALAGNPAVFAEVQIDEYKDNPDDRQGRIAELADYLADQFLTYTMEHTDWLSFIEDEEQEAANAAGTK